MKHAPPPMLVKWLSSLTMINRVAVIDLFAYTCSSLLLLPQGGKWGSHAHSLHQIWPSIAKQAESWLPCRGWHIQHHTSAYHTFASTSQPPLSRKHVCFKPTPSFAIAMPTTTAIKMDGSGDVLQGHCIRRGVILHDAFISLYSQHRTWYLHHNTTTGTIDYWVRKHLGKDTAGKKGMT
jgi:hypothetical protein